MNKLFYGDNLEVLRKYIKDETVDLCYIDPPFNSKRNYNQIYNNIGKEDNCRNVPWYVSTAFLDTWIYDDYANLGLREIQENYLGHFTTQSIDLISGLTKVLGKGSLLAYLVNMTLRIAEIYRVLRHTGSFYLHCDSSASHYLKLILDAIFCSQGGDYKNEIIWKRTSAHSDANRFGKNADRILFYTKSNAFIFNQLYTPYEENYLLKNYKNKDKNGFYKSDDLTGAGATNGDSDMEWHGYKPSARSRHWAIPTQPIINLVGAEKAKKLTTKEKLDLLLENDLIFFTKNHTPRFKRYLDVNKGNSLQELWTDINAISSQARERLGYPTQKPEALLERIINASSKENDVILDAFCGCGTSIAVAQRLNRNWIGIDITYQSISLILKRLEDSFSKEILDLIELNGIPKDLDSAIALANKKDDRTRKEFEKWAVLTYSNNRAIINNKKGKDQGIDGIAYFQGDKDEPEKIILQVKSGKVKSGDIRDLQGTLTLQNAEIGIFITLQEPTKDMIQTAKMAGIYQSKFMSQPVDKILIVTVKDIIENQKRLDLRLSFEVLKSAEKQQQIKANQMTLEIEV